MQFNVVHLLALLLGLLLGLSLGILICWAWLKSRFALDLVNSQSAAKTEQAELAQKLHASASSYQAVAARLVQVEGELQKVEAAHDLANERRATFEERASRLAILDIELNEVRKLADANLTKFMAGQEA